MMKEITKSEAIERFKNSEDILLYHTKLKRMFSTKELLSTCKFLVDTDDIIPTDIDVQPQIKEDNEPPNDTSVDKPISEIDESIENIKHTTQNDVKIETTDEGDDSDPIYAKKRGKPISVDLGMLYSLKHAGWKIKDIALELGCSPGTVSRYINNTELEAQVANMQKSK